MVELVKAASGDMDKFYALRCEQNNIAWTGYISPPQLINFIEWYNKQLGNSKREIYFLKEKDELLGYLYVDFISSESLEIGYGISEAESGKGLGTLMIGLFLKLAKSQGSRSVIALVSEKNISSQKCLLKNGFRKTSQFEVRILPLICGSSKFYTWVKQL